MAEKNITLFTRNVHHSNWITVESEKKIVISLLCCLLCSSIEYSKSGLFCLIRKIKYFVHFTFETDPIIISSHERLSAILASFQKIYDIFMALHRKNHMNDENVVIKTPEIVTTTSFSTNLLNLYHIVNA